MSDVDGWTLLPRVLPAPAAASTVLRRAVESGPVPDPAASVRAAPATTDQWADFIGQRDDVRSEEVSAAALALDVRIEADRVGDIAVHHLTPPIVAPEHLGHLVVYVHGGAFVLGAGIAGLGEAILIAARVGIRVLSIDYRMPPAHPYPCGLDDVCDVWRSVVRDRPPAGVAMAGTSAGGGLILSALLRMRESGDELPAAVYLGSPWADLTPTGDSRATNDGADRILVTYDAVLSGASRLYAGERSLDDPMLSPVRGEFTGLPPTLLVTGTRDLFLSDTARVHAALRARGCSAELLVLEGVSHAEFALVADAPESHLTYAQLGRFLEVHLAARAAGARG